MELEKITLSYDRTHHLYNDLPIYSKRFIVVEKFHQPGFAPVIDSTGAYHIDINGNEAYQDRFDQSFGFYSGIAVVEKNGNWFHIIPNGEKIYNHHYNWLGNFQEGICVAKKDRVFFHINSKGELIYSQKYNYVGDFKDGYAVVYLDSKATHINAGGKYLHNKWFKRLDNFHKGYACAEDDNGWFHIDIKGDELYSARYKNVEPFYNKLALVESFDGQIKQINIKNNNTHEVKHFLNQETINELYGDLVGFWKTKLISSAVKLNLIELLPNNASEISRVLGVPLKNLYRLLRALWELSMLEYDTKNDLWIASDKGKIFQMEQYKFLKYAAIMWDKISCLDWDKLPKILKQEEIKSFKSFKDLEAKHGIRHIYQIAIDGYLQLDLDKIVAELIKFNNFNNILCIGRSANLLADHLKKRNLTDINTKFSLESLRENSKNYNYVVALKFIHYFDDTKAEEIIKLFSEANITNIIIIEMLVSKDKPNGGVLDINMLIECGGKLRNIVEHSLLLNKHGYKIYKTSEINPYLHMIYASI